MDPFDNLTPMKYGLLMADPPWSFDNYSVKGERKNAKFHYECMSIEDICAMPVGHLASKNCLLWLWATNPMLPQALVAMERWGFQFKTAGTWVKTTRHGKTAFGTGYVLRSANEPFLIGTIGTVKCTRGVRSVVYGQIREHSRKPDEAYAAAEQLVPHVHRAELFSRQARQGWEVWGNQSQLFSERPE